MWVVFVGIGLFNGDTEYLSIEFGRSFTGKFW